ncbi:DUF4189 domain-containing protein [Variovorax sp. ZT4R33]|uniref:DUF4189 domain-containing protein n=1 Tax=Variovorax sp. ZT4R33 TaxID=3443743 RepID=UPI003F47C96A
MFTSFLRGLLVTGLCFLWAGIVHAQAACPPGQIPYGSGNGLNVCGPSNRQQSAPQPPAPQWESRWGAIATDAPKGVIGATVDKPSKREASQAAVSDCQQQGGVNCRIDVAYDNQCAVLVVGVNGYNTPNAATVEKATELGMKTCREAGSTDCRVLYSACSLPVRIR